MTERYAAHEPIPEIAVHLGLDEESRRPSLAATSCGLAE